MRRWHDRIHCRAGEVHHSGWDRLCFFFRVTLVGYDSVVRFEPREGGLQQRVLHLLGLV